MSERVDIIPVESRPVEDFPGYRIGIDGSLWSCWKKHGRSFVQSDKWRRRNGGLTGRHREYRAYYLRSESGPQYKRAHLLVLEAFVGPRPEGMEGCHNDGNALNCHVSNLRWDTPEANANDKKVHGTEIYGERNGQCKVPDDVARQIIESNETTQQLSDRLGIGKPTINSIRRGSTRANLRSECKIGGVERWPKFSDETVLSILADGGESKELAEKYGVSRQTVNDLKTGRSRRALWNRFHGIAS